jgi:hypothetical protein
MPKTYEQEVLEIESARISADLAYQREKNVVYNKQLFSKRDFDDLEKRYLTYTLIAAIISALGSALLMYLYCNQSK